MGKYDFLKIALAQPGQLSEQDELDLVRQYKGGNMQAYTKLRLSLRPLIEKAIADAMSSGNQVSASNLRMRADREMPKIIQGFDTEKDVKLKTYIIGRLSGYLRNATAENMPGPYVPRNQHSDLQKYKGAIRSAELEFGKNPSEDQIRAFYPNEPHMTDFDKIKQYHVKSYLADATFGEDDESDGLTFKDQFTQGNVINQDDLYSSIDEEEKDDVVKQNFTPTEQQIINAITKDGKSFAETALSLGVSTSEIRKTIRRWHELTQN